MSDTEPTQRQLMKAGMALASSPQFQVVLQYLEHRQSMNTILCTTYTDPCHLHRAQGATQELSELIDLLRGRVEQTPRRATLRHEV